MTVAIRCLGAVLLIVMLGILAGCSGSTRLAQTAAPMLPPPSSFVRKPSSASSGALLGGDFIASANLASTGTFSPNFDGESLGSAAWAVYRFPAGSIATEDQLQLIWESALDPSSLWVGLGDQAADRWDWFSLADPSLLQFDPTDKYAAPDGSALVAVLLLGSTANTLKALRFGGGTSPVAAVSASPSSGAAPFQVTLDASGSADPDDAIVHYGWDLDGDGIYESDGGALSSYSFTLDVLPQQQLVGVQVTDAANNTATATATIDVNGVQFVTPPQETYNDSGSWLADAYKPLPEWRDSNRVFQNAWFTDQANHMLTLINAERAQNSAGPLVLSPHLELVAQAHSRNSALHNFSFQHTDQYGLQFWQRPLQVNCPVPVDSEFMSAVEDAQATMDFFTADNTYHSIMVDPNHKYAAVGFYENPGTTTFVWTILFTAANPETGDWLEPNEVP